MSEHLAHNTITAVTCQLTDMICALSSEKQLGTVQIKSEQQISQKYVRGENPVKEDKV